MLDYNDLKDSVQNIAKSTKIAQLQAKFESVKKENENEHEKLKRLTGKEKKEQNQQA